MADNVGSRLGQDDLGKLILRLSVAILLLLHGIAKLKNGVGWMAGPLGAVGLPAWFAYGSFVGEVIAPLLVIAGKWTRLAGLVIAADMAFAILLVRRGDIAQLNQGGGWAIELEMLFLLAGVALFFLGSGRYGVSRGAGTFD